VNLPLVRAFAAALLSATLVTSASAQSGPAFPNQMVRIVVPFSAGSMSDIFAREIADKLNRKWNQTVIVENRPGVPGTAATAKAPADGYTMMLTSNGHAILNSIAANLSFDAVKDFEGVSLIAKLPVLVVVPNTLPANSLKEFAALAKSKPDELSYASAGLGSTSNIAAEHFIRAQGIKMLHVPYKGAPDSYTSIVRGDTQAFFTPPGVGEDLVLSGKVKALAVSGPARLPKFPDVPTFAEAGLPEAAYEAWFGLLVPTGVPREVLAKLSKDVGEVVTTPEMTSRMAQRGVMASTSSPAELSDLLRNDAVQYGGMFARPAN
jgi:tripartite-type tricarboxylate transporter receptor subunit TctC